MLLVVAILVVSCKTNKSLTDNKELENALLWKIEGNDLSTPSYLYGTIHMIDAKDYFLPEGTLAAIDASEKMVFEIDMNEMNDMSKIMGIMSQAFMADNLSLEDLISEEDYKLVDEHFQEVGLPLAMLKRLKPMFLTVFASSDMDPNGLQMGSLKSYEMEFAEMANDANMETGGLETIEFQMGVFDEIPYEAQAEMLVEAIKNADAGTDEFDVMTELYLTQNINGMVTMIGDEDKELAKYEDILLHKRNRAWIPQMATMMKEGPVFFAVGAGHLGGPIGVITLLKNEGYKLTPISNVKN